MQPLRAAAAASTAARSVARRAAPPLAPGAPLASSRGASSSSATSAPVIACNVYISEGRDSALLATLKAAAGPGAPLPFAALHGRCARRVALRRARAARVRGARRFARPAGGGADARLSCVAPRRGATQRACTSSSTRPTTAPASRSPPRGRTRYGQPPCAANAIDLSCATTHAAEPAALTRAPFRGAAARRRGGPGARRPGAGAPLPRAA